MQTDYSSDTQLSKDELLEILNEIDTGQADDVDSANDHRNEVGTNHIYPNPTNQFY